MKKVTRKRGFTVRENKCALGWAKKIILVRESGGACSKCGNSNIFVLDFHHLDGSNKDKNIAQFITNNSLDEAREEAKKCIILCRNCHQQIHYSGNDKRSKEKGLFLKILGIYSCQECGYHGDNYACLDFHHIDPEEKRFSISRYFSRRCELSGIVSSIEEVIEEAKKCKVLCRNCHSILHIKSERFKRIQEYINHKVENYKGKKKIDFELGETIKKMHCEEKIIAPEIARRLGFEKTTIIGFLKRNNCYKYKGESGLAIMWKKRKEEKNGKENNT